VTGTTLEFDLTELAASIPPPACEHCTNPGRPKCGVGAVSLLVLSCGHTGYVCPTHRDVTEQHLKAGAHCKNMPHQPTRPTWRFEAC